MRLYQLVSLVFLCLMATSVHAETLDTASDQAKIPTQGVVAEESQTLDLSLPKQPLTQEAIDETADSIDIEQESLPNLFDAEKEQGPVIVSGDVIVEEEETTDYRDKIKGGEISVEIKTP